MEQTKKIEFFMLIKSYHLSQLSAKILEGKTFDVQRNWQLNWAVFSKAIELTRFWHFTIVPGLFNR